MHTYLYQGHLGLIGELDLLLLGGVGVVLVLVEPLLEWARHVVERFALVAHVAARLLRLLLLLWWRWRRLLRTRRLPGHTTQQSN